LLGAAILISALATKPVEIRVLPHALIAGASMRVTCRVQPDEANRWLKFGIEGYTQSEYMLEGRESKITYERVFDHIPCGTGLPFCELIREDGRRVRVTEQVAVVGCESSTP
jgi:hypothetical protein